MAAEKRNCVTADEIRIVDKNGNARIHLGIDPDTYSAFINMYDVDSCQSLSICETNGGVSVSTLNKNGSMAIGIGPVCEGLDVTGITICNSTGKLGTTIHVDHANGGIINIFGGSEQIRKSI